MRFATVFLTLAAIAFGQVAERTVATTVSAAYPVPADEAAFAIQLGAPQFVSTDQVLRAFGDFNLKAENVVSVATVSSFGGSFTPVIQPNPNPPFTITWVLEFRVPAARLKETADRLDTLSRRVPEPFSTLNYSGGLAYSQKALDSATAATVSSLMPQARARATAMARLTGGNPEPLVSLADLTRPPIIFSFALGFPAQASTLLVSTNLSTRFGQAPDRFLSTGCSQEAILPADEAVFRLNVESPATASREDTLAPLARLGITERDLVDVAWSLPAAPVPTIGGPPSLIPRLSYQFETRQPVSRVRETLDRLAELRRTPPEPLATAIYGIGLAVSAAASEQAYNKTSQDALATCRSRAEAIARAAGVRLGSVRSVTPDLSGRVTIPVAVFRGGTEASLAMESDLRLSLPITVVYGLE